MYEIIANFQPGNNNHSDCSYLNIFIDKHWTDSMMNLLVEQCKILSTQVPNQIFEYDTIAMEGLWDVQSMESIVKLSAQNKQ